MPLSKARIAANRRYNEKTYERIPFNVRHDSEFNKAAISAHAAAMGETLNGFLKRAVQETIERDRKQGLPG